MCAGRTAEAFPGSAAYWERRYAAGGDSGVGSYGAFARFKADFLNRFVADNQVRSVIEFGCGDGHQLGLATYPAYIGFDVSDTAIAHCRQRYRSDLSKSFHLLGEYHGQEADLTLSLDVIYHLVEDEVFEQHMRLLFGASGRHVIVYSSDSHDNDGYEGTHIRHRQFSHWIEVQQQAWRLTETVPNRYPYRGDYRTGTFSDFFVYSRQHARRSA
jgi:SAM-dependent methyltransferase